MAYGQVLEKLHFLKISYGLGLEKTASLKRWHMAKASRSKIYEEVRRLVADTAYVK